MPQSPQKKPSLLNDAEAAVRTADGDFKVFGDIVSKITVSHPKAAVLLALAIGAFVGHLV